MKKNRKLKIEEMKIPEDIAEIASWEKKYGNDPEYESIRKFLDFEGEQYRECLEFVGQPVESTENYSLVDIIRNNYLDGLNDINNFEEQRLALVVRNNEKEIILWALLDYRDICSNLCPVYIDAIVVHPKYQNQGLATKFASELFLKPENYFCSKPDEYFTTVSNDNEAAKSLFKKFGFKLEENNKYTNVFADSPKLVSEGEPSTFGE